MTQQDDGIASRLSRIEARLARIEEALMSAKDGQEQDPMAAQQKCYAAWVDHLQANPQAVEAHLSVHEMAALKASINAPVPPPVSGDSSSYSQLFHRP